MVRGVQDVLLGQRSKFFSLLLGGGENLWLAGRACEGLLCSDCLPSLVFLEGSNLIWGCMFVREVVGVLFLSNVVFRSFVDLSTHWKIEECARHLWLSAIYPNHSTECFFFRHNRQLISKD